jgi:hypothetical protein
VLLESLSSLEPQTNTYLQLNADKYDVSGEALERLRVSGMAKEPYITRKPALFILPK